MEINNGINIGSIFSLNNSQKKPIAEIVEFECFSFKNLLEINDIEGCLKMLNGNNECGGLVFLFKAKKNLELLNKTFYISGFKTYIFKENGHISLIRQFNKKDLANTADNSSTQRVEDNDNLIQFGFLWFFEEENDLNNANKMYIETYFAIDNIHTSYLVNKELNTFSDNKFVSRNMDIAIENRNVYNCLF